MNLICICAIEIVRGERGNRWKEVSGCEYAWRSSNGQRGGVRACTLYMWGGKGHFVVVRTVRCDGKRRWRCCCRQFTSTFPIGCRVRNLIYFLLFKSRFSSHISTTKSWKTHGQAQHGLLQLNHLQSRRQRHFQVIHGALLLRRLVQVLLSSKTTTRQRVPQKKRR